MSIWTKDKRSRYIKEGRGAGVPLVLTTNFLLTIRDPNGKERYIARSIKDSSELTRKITFEKMEIENRYWRAKGIEWKITTDKQLLRQFAKNIEWVRETMLVTESNEVDKDQLSVTLLNHLLNNHEFILSDILKDFDKREGASKGAGLYLFRFLLAKKEIKINMRNKIDLSLRVKDLMT
ncbi:TnsA endonuclease N-terminal domain-containing protein [Paenibacillus sp. TAF58]